MDHLMGKQLDCIRYWVDTF